MASTGGKTKQTKPLKFNAGKGAKKKGGGPAGGAKGAKAGKGAFGGKAKKEKAEKGGRSASKGDQVHSP